MKPGARLGLVWNVRDESVDWVAAITRVIEPYVGDAPRYWKQTWRQGFPHPAFTPLEETTFTHAHIGPPEQEFIARTLSTSFIAALPEDERRHVREQLAQLIATHPALRGQATVSYPYKTHAFMAVRS